MVKPKGGSECELLCDVLEPETFRHLRERAQQTATESTVAPTRDEKMGVSGFHVKRHPSCKLTIIGH